MTQASSIRDEWVCGKRILKVQITGEGEPYHPLAIMWMDSTSGKILGMDARRPDEGLNDASEKLQQLMARPMEGTVKVPRQIRTASGMLAEVLSMSLSASHPNLQIIVAPTPEIEAAFDDIDAMPDGYDDSANQPVSVDSPSVEGVKAIEAAEVTGAKGAAPNSTRAHDATIKDEQGYQNAAIPVDPKQLVAALRQLQKDASEDSLDVDTVQEVTQALFEHYVGSSQAAAFDKPLEGPEIIGQCAAQHHGRTILALGEGYLDDVLFETLPAKVTAGPEVARPIIDTMRSLYVWLKREHGVEEVDELIELLGDDAIREFERCMTDTELAGPVKSMLMDAMKAGVDLSDEESIKAYMRTRIGTQLPGGELGMGGPFGFGRDDYFGNEPSPSHPPLTPEQQRSQQKKRKKDRKAARKSRKKNR